MRRKDIQKVFLFVIKLAVGILLISPILYALMVSFMNPEEVSSYPPRIIPKVFQLVNYDAVLSTYPLFKFLSNSIIVCLVVIAAQVVFSSLTAYALVFLDFPFKRLLFTFIQMTMMIPMESIVITNYITVCDLGLVNTYPALVMPYLVSGMSIFLMRQYYMTIPRELKDASEIDGCSDWGFIWHIAMPVSVPTIASLGVYTFVRTYNQYMWPLFVTNSMEMRTVQVGISMLIDGEAINYGIVTAGAVFVLIPVILVFVFGQKYLINGMTSGAVKG